ncbi:poly [Labeo rohita]|uniref:Poly n=1 Tax=Labeo rohita TaxID=84645 RepID=A0A498M604_LABRO|nr:poly [Labeo rohita]
MVGPHRRPQSNQRPHCEAVGLLVAAAARPTKRRGTPSLPPSVLLCFGSPRHHGQMGRAELTPSAQQCRRHCPVKFMIGLFSAPPFNTYRVSPLGVATRKFSGKKHLIIDLSSPHNSPFPSINSLIPLEEFSLHYHDIDQAIILIKDADRGAWLAKLNITSSFRTLEDITDSCRNELSLWISFLSQWNGLSFFYNNLISSPIDIQLFTNAAPSVGFGGFYQGRWFASTWPDQLLDLTQQQISSALFELYSLVVAALLWGKEWSATSILVHCNNEAIIHCINKGRSHSPALMPLLRHLIWTLAHDQFIITAKHVPGSKNQIADSLSLVLPSRSSDCWHQRRNNSQPQYLTIHN